MFILFKKSENPVSKIDLNLLFIKIGYNLQGLNIILWHWFYPHRLPNARSRSIKNEIVSTSITTRPLFSDWYCLNCIALILFFRFSEFMSNGWIKCFLGSNGKLNTPGLHVLETLNN